MTHTYITKDKKVTYSNLSLKLSKMRKYVIELISVKSYKRGLIFPVVSVISQIIR